MAVHTEPVSLRLEKKLIDQLKKRARKESYSRDIDVNYVDLIREAAYGILERKPTELVEIACEADPDMEYMRANLEFWTTKQIEEFKASPKGMMIMDCINTGDYTKFIALFRRAINKWFINKSIACKALVHEPRSAGSDEIWTVFRDLGSIAHVVARRGAIPEAISEGEEICTPKFEVCAYPSVREVELKPHNLISMIAGTSRAIQKEIDTNVINALEATAEHRQDQIVYTNYLSPSNFTDAIANITQHRDIPNCIIVHPKVYVQMKSFGIVVGPPLKAALENEDYGTMHGIPIVMSERASANKILITAKPGALGVLFSYPQINVRHEPDRKKLREGFVVNHTIGIVIVSDYLVSMIEIEDEQTKLRQKAKELEAMRKAKEDKSTQKSK